MFRTRWALASLLAACLLAGCSDDAPEPKIDADPTPSEAPTSASVSVSPTVAPTPSTGPRETVARWLAAWTTAMTSGRTDDVAAISASTCSSCQRLIDQVAGLYAKGGRLETDGWRATKLSEAPDAVASTPSFVMQVVQARQVLYDRDGVVVDDTPSSTVPMRMTFELQDNRWVLGKLEILK